MILRQDEEGGNDYRLADLSVSLELEAVGLRRYPSFWHPNGRANGRCVCWCVDVCVGRATTVKTFHR